MAYLVPGTTGIKYLKQFNGLRRTKEGMLYLTNVNPNSSNDAIQVSNYYEDGKSDAVGRDQTDYVEERLEMIDVQYFTGDGSTKAFTLSSPVLNETRLAVFLDGVRQAGSRQGVFRREGAIMKFWSLDDVTDGNMNYCETVMNLETETVEMTFYPF